MSTFQLPFTGDQISKRLAGYSIVSSSSEMNELSTINNAIVNGSLCYCTADSKFYQYNGTSWVEAKLGGIDEERVRKIFAEELLSNEW